MNAWTIYWIGQASAISNCLSILVALLIVFWLGLAFITAVHNDTSYDEWKYPSKKILLIPLVLLLINTFIPSTKTLAMMYVVPEITQNENFKALPEDVAVFLRKLMADYDKDKKE